MAKITYLFGAGASCGAMPLVCNLPQRMGHMISILESNQLSKTEEFGFRYNNISSKYDFQVAFLNDLKDLVEKSSNHYTVDTYAKKLYARQELSALYQLKLLLSCYFTLEQMLISGKCDDRYDSFWASLIGSTYKDLPDNVRILTWNYDIQMELSFAEYCPEESFKAATEVLNVHVNNNIRRTLNQPGRFGIYKLNGTANNLVFNPDNLEQTVAFNFKDGLNIEWIEKITRMYSEIKAFKRHTPTLSFAWESPKGNPETRFTNIIQSEITNSEILVVIGYSFPFFNRDIDRALCRSMKNLKKVYIQDIEVNNVISSFRSIMSDWTDDDMRKKIEPVMMKNQFFLPPDL